MKSVKCAADGSQGTPGCKLGVVRVSLAGDTKVGGLLERFWPKRKRAGGDLLGSVPSALCMSNVEHMCGLCQGERSLILGGRVSHGAGHLGPDAKRSDWCLPSV